MADGARAAHVRRLGALLEAGRSGAVWTDTIDEAFVESARRDDLGPLLYNALRRTGTWDAQSAVCREKLSTLARESAALDAARCEIDRRVLHALEGINARPLIFKGAALSHRTYPEAWLRPRVDTDILIPVARAADAAQTLERLGLSRVLRPTGDYVTHQYTYVASVADARFAYDVHWKISDPQVFADLFTHEELDAEAVSVPALGPAARAIADVHALLVACVHRVAHHHDEPMALFLYDIDLLARSFDEAAWRRFTTMASGKRMVQVCARGLRLAADRFGTPVPPELSSDRAASVADEPSAAYLRDGLRRVDILVSDIRALGWRARARLLREHLLPPRAYMRAAYGRQTTLLLPALYAHRIARGTLKWFRPLHSK